MMTRLMALLICLAVVIPLSSYADQKIISDPLVPDGEDIGSVFDNSVWGSGGSIYDIALSPDSSMLVTGSDDKTIRLYNFNTGKELRRLDTHTSGVTAVSFSPNGRLLASGSADKTVRLFEVASGKQLWQVDNFAGAIYGISFSPDGQFLAVGSQDRIIRLLDISTGKEVGSIDAYGEKPFVRFCPNGRILASSSQGRVTFFDIKNGKEVRRIETPTAKFHRISFSSDGQLLAAASEGKSIYLFDVATGSELRRLDAHSGAIADVDFSADGRILASSSEDKTARIFEVATGRELRQFEDKGGISRIKISPDGRFLAMLSAQSRIRIIDIFSTQVYQEIHNRHPQINAVTIGRDGQAIAFHSDDSLIRIMEKGTISPLLIQYQDSILHPRACKSRSKIVLASRKGTLAIINKDNFPFDAKIVNLGKEPTPISAVACHPDEGLIAVGGWDNSVALIDESNNRTLCRTSTHNLPVVNVALSEKNQFVVSAALDRTIQIHDLNCNQVRRFTLEELEIKDLDEIVVMHFDEEQNKLLVTFESSSVSVYDGKTGVKLKDSNILQLYQLWNPSAKESLDRIRQMIQEQKEGLSGSQQLLERNPYFRFDVFEGLGELLRDPYGRGRILLPTDRNGAILVEIPSLGKGRYWLGSSDWAAEIGGRLYRHDDGRLLYRRREDGSLESIPPVQPKVAPQLSAEVLGIQAPGEALATGRVTVRVSNAPSGGRAYWLTVEGRSLPKGMILLPPPVQLRLEPGEKVDLPITLSALSPAGEEPRPNDATITVTLRHAFGEGPSITVPVHWRAPRLILSSSRLIGDRSSAAVELEIKNIGDQDPQTLTVMGYFFRFSQPAKSRFPAQSQEVKLDGLEPGKSTKISLTVPDPIRQRLDFYVKPVQVELAIHGGLWPGHEWHPITPSLRPPLVFNLIILLIGTCLAILTYLAWLQRDDIVRSVQATPEALLQYDFFKIPDVNRLLKRTFRLRTTLDRLSKPDTLPMSVRWMRAVNASRSPLHAAKSMSEALGAKLDLKIGSSDSDYYLFTIELLGLRLRFPVNSALLIVTNPSLEFENINQLVGEMLHNEGGIKRALAIDLTENKELRAQLKSARSVSFVVLSANQFRDLLFSTKPREYLEKVISAQIDRADLSPYITDAGIQDDQMFFGREMELASFADRVLHNLILVGSRQMGKSSLLHALDRRLKKRSNVNPIYLSLQTPDIGQELASRRGRTAPTSVPEFYALCAGRKDCPNVWLLDEADQIVLAERSIGQQWSRTFRALAEEGLAYFVLSGFWQLFAAANLDTLHPLRNFGKTHRLRPLDHAAALRLATEPMAALQLDYESDKVVENILHQTGCRPNLIAFCCTGLIENAKPKQRVIRAADVDYILKHYEPLSDALNFWENIDSTSKPVYGLTSRERILDRMIVRVALLLNRPTRDDILEKLEEYGVVIPSDALKSSLTRHDINYVLITDTDNHLYCPMPLLQRHIEQDSDRGLLYSLKQDIREYLRNK